MNLLYGEIVNIEINDGMRLGDVTVSGAMKKVPLELLEDVTEGDTVLLCDGVAIARASASQITEGGNHVLGNTR